MSEQSRETAFGKNQSLLEKLGPGLITGAADDDPSGIATYSQVGAAFGYGMLWTALFSFPLMVAIQMTSALIGRVSGAGLAENMRKHSPPWLVHSIVILLLIANVINIAADIGAMGAALQLLVGGSPHLYAVGFGLLSLALQVFISFERYAPILKVLTLALFAYVATVFVVDVPWEKALQATLLPPLSFKADYLVAVVAVFGTTISPYLFFWQATQEVEEQRGSDSQMPLKVAPWQARRQVERIKVDTYVGMGFSNAVAFFVMLTAAVTLHAHGIANIDSTAQAAKALRPVAGEFAFLLFSFGIVGAGLLAVPILAGSAAYAVAETFKWKTGLGKHYTKARGFYAILAFATLLGVALNFTPVDPIKALYYSAVVNGVIAVPVMVAIMRMATKPEVMGKFVITRRLKLFGWLATLVMAAVVVAMFITSER
ncbi:MAG: NRAMP family divalent metal transporter [Betaproteobacteria bacterium]